MDPANAIEALKAFAIVDFACAFLQWRRDNHGIAKFMAIVGFTTVLMAVCVKKFS